MCKGFAEAQVLYECRCVGSQVEVSVLQPRGGAAPHPPVGLEERAGHVCARLGEGLGQGAQVNKKGAVEAEKIVTWSEQKYCLQLCLELI